MRWGLGGSRACSMEMKTVSVLLVLVWLCGGAVDGRVIAAAEPKPRRTAVFALGSFWNSEAVFGCLEGVIRTTVGYSGGSKENPDYHSIGDHAEAVEVEYNPQYINYEQLLDVFWANHDPTQVFGQGPDVGDQFRSIIFTQGTEEQTSAEASKVREQGKFTDVAVLTKIQPLTVFHQAEAEHQKFELRRRPELLQILSDLPEEGFARCTRATKLNAYATGACSSYLQKLIKAKIQPFLKERPKLQFSFPY